MAKVPRFMSKIAWSIKKQSLIGTALSKTDLTKFLKLADPIIINERAEHWTDRGMTGLDHEFETARGILRQFVEIEIPVQPMPVDFIGYLVGLAFSTSTPTLIDQDIAYKHTSKFTILSTTPDAYFTTFAMYEDGTDQCVEGLACTSLTIRGDGSNRMECGGTFIGTKIGTALSSFTWPDAVASRFLWNYAGIFTMPGDAKAQLRSFELTVNPGINMDLAFIKTATEAARIHPSLYPLTPDRGFSLSTRIIAEAGNLATFRAAQLAGTEIAVALSCLGAVIATSDPETSDEAIITVPKGIVTEVGQDFGEGGNQNLDLTFDGRYDTTGTLNSPIKVDVVNGIVAYFPA